MNEYSFRIEEPDAGKRLDVVLCEFVSGMALGLSRTALQQLIKEERVSVDNTVHIRPHDKIRAGQLIRIIVPDKKISTLDAEEIPLDVVYEDEHLAVINKQVGLVVHPAPGNKEHTLVNAILARFAKLSDINPERPGIVHRLDKETSGLLVIAKTNAAHLKLAKQFAEHSIKRAYVALVRGKVEFDENIIEMPIGRHPTRRQSMAISFNAGSRYAKTYYRTLERTERFSLLRLEPYTGRTHQLRVHCAFIGHPIVGDKKYGTYLEFKRMALHALYLGFVHPHTGKFVEFKTDIPEDFTDFITAH